MLVCVCPFSGLISYKIKVANSLKKYTLASIFVKEGEPSSNAYDPQRLILLLKLRACMASFYRVVSWFPQEEK